MLDTSRNYYEVEDLLRLIRAISMNKLNVFHWHITDSHSFPLVVPSEPEMAAKGAYGDEMKYTAADVQRVVEYGMEHGVRVIPEIDMPGELISHLHSVCLSFRPKFSLYFEISVLEIKFECKFDVSFEFCDSIVVDKKHCSS